MTHLLTRDQIRTIVFRAIDVTRELSLDESVVPNDEGAALLGEGAGLDSMGFVNFVVALEKEMSRVTDRALHLAEELNSPNGAAEPIYTLGQFIDFLHNVVQP